MHEPLGDRVMEAAPGSAPPHLPVAASSVAFAGCCDDELDRLLSAVRVGQGAPDHLVMKIAGAAVLGEPTKRQPAQPAAP